MLWVLFHYIPKQPIKDRPITEGSEKFSVFFQDHTARTRQSRYLSTNTHHLPKVRRVEGKYLGGAAKFRKEPETYIPETGRPSGRPRGEAGLGDLHEDFG